LIKIEHYFADYIIIKMPNHCDNFVECIQHEDTEMIKRLKESLCQDPPSFFATFIPCPENDTPDAYWGTKWDVYDVVIEEETNNSLQISFFTAWTPPLQAYHHLKQIGFIIYAGFAEPGCDFCGYWKDGDEEFFENVSENIDMVPEEFRNYFCDPDEDPN